MASAPCATATQVGLSLTAATTAATFRPMASSQAISRPTHFMRRTAEPLDSWAATLAAPRHHIPPRSTSTSRAIGSIVEDIVSVPHRNIRIAGTGVNARDGLTPRKAPGTAASTASRLRTPLCNGTAGDRLLIWAEWKRYSEIPKKIALTAKSVKLCLVAYCQRSVTPHWGQT